MKGGSLISEWPALVAEVLFRLRGGPVRTWRWILDRIRDGRLDRQFGIYSSPKRSSKELGFQSPDLVPYQAVSFSDLREILDNSSISSRDVLLDFGSGMGRVVCFAAVRYELQSVMGVEISPQLCEIARRNLEGLRPRFKCCDVKIVNADAVEYEVPDHVTLVYFFNPFRGEVLTQVLENIERSCRRSPRRIRVLFYGTVSSRGFREEASRHPWLILEATRLLRTGAMLLSYVTSSETKS